MGQWFSWVKSNEKEILTLLNDLAKKSVEAAEAVQVLLTDPTNKDQVRTVTEIETAADGIIREIFTELNNTFITPLDREDMQRVASKIDDIIDFMDGIASRFNSYKITVTPPYALDIANELVNATKEVEYMTSKLQHIKNPSVMIEHCRNTSAIEHKVDILYRSAITELFESEDAIKII